MVRSISVVTSLAALLAVASAQSLDDGINIFEAAQTSPSGNGLEKPVDGQLCFGNAGWGLTCTPYEPAKFTPNVPGKGGNAIEGSLVWFSSFDTNRNLCEPTGIDLSESIAIVRRGGCYYCDKAKHAQDAGAVGVVIHLPGKGPLVVPIGPPGESCDGITIPVLLIHFDNANKIRDVDPQCRGNKCDTESCGERDFCNIDLEDCGNNDCKCKTPVTEAPVTEAPVTDPPVDDGLERLLQADLLPDCPEDDDSSPVPDVTEAPTDVTQPPTNSRCIDGNYCNGFLFESCDPASDCFCFTNTGPTEEVTEAPVTEAPVTEAPVTEAPVTEAPVTDPPVDDGLERLLQGDNIPPECPPDVMTIMGTPEVDDDGTLAFPELNLPITGWGDEKDNKDDNSDSADGNGKSKNGLAIAAGAAAAAAVGLAAAAIFAYKRRSVKSEDAVVDILSNQTILDPASITFVEAEIDAGIIKTTDETSHEVNRNVLEKML